MQAAGSAAARDAGRSPPMSLKPIVDTSLVVSRSAHIAFSVVLLVGAFGCSHREPLPPSHATPRRLPGGETADPRANAPERAEVRRLHATCDATVVALRDDVDDADRRESLLTAVAALAYVVGRLADGDGVEGGLYGPGSTQSYRCTPGTYEGPGCGFEPLPSRSLGEGGPIDAQTDEVHLDAADQVRAINRGVDALDDLLFSRPDPGEWTEADRARFEELTHALAEVCTH